MTPYLFPSADKSFLTEVVGSGGAALAVGAFLTLMVYVRYHQPYSFFACIVYSVGLKFFARYGIGIELFIPTHTNSCSFNEVRKTVC